MRLDKQDAIILSLLQHNCRLTNKEIAHKTNLSVTAAYERIKKLERTGVIDQYVAIIDKEKVARSFMVLCHIKLEKHTKPFLNDFEKAILKLNEVIECIHTSGEYDYMLKICVKDMAAYREFLITELTTLQHIGSTHSVFVINQVKMTTVIPVQS